MPGAYIIIERDEFRRVAFPAAFRAGKQAVFIGEAVAFALFKAVGAGEMFPAQGRVVCQPRGKVFFRVALNGAHDAVFRVIAGSKGPLTPAVRAVTHRNTLVFDVWFGVPIPMKKPRLIGASTGLGGLRCRA